MYGLMYGRLYGQAGLTRHWNPEAAQFVAAVLDRSDGGLVSLLHTDNFAVLAVVGEKHSMTTSDHLAHVWVILVVLFHAAPPFCASAASYAFLVMPRH